MIYLSIKAALKVSACINFIAFSEQKFWNSLFFHSPPLSATSLIGYTSTVDKISLNFSTDSDAFFVFISLAHAKPVCRCEQSKAERLIVNFKTYAKKHLYMSLCSDDFHFQHYGKKFGRCIHLFPLRLSLFKCKIVVEQ